MNGPDDRQRQELRELARRVAVDTGQYLLSGVGADPADTKSSRTDLVTEFDRGAEARIVDTITASRPHDAFMGEEGTDTPGTSGVRWIIDPIDGTVNFVLGHPGFSVSIAAEVDGTVVAGAVADPIHGDVYDAALGMGARWNGRLPGPRPTTELSRAIIATGFSYVAAERRVQAMQLVDILPAIADIRRMGSAAVDLCSVAVGRCDGYFESGLKPWDMAAGALVATEAGAVLHLPPADDPTAPVVAAAPGIADALVALLRDARLHDVPGQA